MMSWELPQRWGTSPTLLETGGMGADPAGQAPFGTPGAQAPTPPAGTAPSPQANPEFSQLAGPGVSAAQMAMLAAQRVQDQQLQAQQAADANANKIPTWAYVAGGVAVLGVGYFLFFHQKGRR